MARSPNPRPMPNARWMKVVGVIFATIILVFFLVLGGYAAISPGSVVFDCVTFSFLAVAFAIGGAASASFLGGGAAIDGDLGVSAKSKPLRISLYGGVAVLIIVFVAFFALKPADCSQNNDSAHWKIEFENVPKGYRASAGNEFWVRHQLMAVGNASRMTVRIDDSKVDKGRIVIAQNDSVICTLFLSVLDDMASDDEHYHYHTIDPQTPFKVSVHIDTKRVEQKLPQDCFKRASVVVPETVEFGFNTSLLRFEKPRLPTLEDGEQFIENGSLTIPLKNKSENEKILANWVNKMFASVAYAQDLPVPYEDLVLDLSSSNPDLRIDSRRFLAANLSDYIANVRFDLVSIENEEDAEFLTSLLHGLNEGIRLENPELKPASGRDLSVSLPFLETNELARIIELSGHENPSVRKQARRFIQTFPIDDIEMQIGQLVAENEIECRSANDGWLAYASVFYYYNRIIQEGLNGQIDLQRVDYWDAKTDQVQQAVKNCISESHNVDAALLDYGRATAYNWAIGINENASFSAAQDFLDFIGDRGEDYYLSRHVNTMEAIAGAN
ncbi:MAG: hypothetical protein AAF429_03535 [Pseudomonadota bacterium]